MSSSREPLLPARIRERLKEDAMDAVTRVDGGLSADDIVERSAGGLDHRAILLTELGSALYAVGEEFRYTDSEEATEVVRLSDELAVLLADLSLLPSGDLTSWRQCQRCSGNGATSGEDPCAECRGAGAVHRDEAAG